MAPRISDVRDGPTEPLVLARARRLRREQSPVERKMWWILRDRRLGGYKFRRQFPVGKYSADFCCCEKSVVVEIDGIQQENTAEADLIREEFIKTAGFRVIRFWATDIGRHHDEVLERILGFLEL